MPCQSYKAYSALSALKRIFPDAKTSICDGLRFDWPHGWIHVRLSMTEPIIRIIQEWKDPKEGAQKGMHLRAALERLVAE